jgi:hypothetical protein
MNRFPGSAKRVDIKKRKRSSHLWAGSCFHAMGSTQSIFIPRKMFATYRNPRLITFL